jgi:hypothetical protein
MVITRLLCAKRWLAGSFLNIQPAAAGAQALLYFGGIVQGQMVKWSDSSLTYTHAAAAPLFISCPENPPALLRYIFHFSCSRSHHNENEQL